MTIEQALAFAIVAGVIALLVSGRVRYDLAGAVALLASVAAGIVRPEDAFRGLSDDIVIIVGSALVVSAAITRSGIIERLIRPITPYMKITELQIAVLVTLVALLSAFMKNIGALAMFMPIAFQVARRTGRPVSRLLMPLAFGSLLGGLMTLIGTSPNVIVSRLREDIVGRPFAMFDFLPVGLWITAAGVVFLVIGWRLLPQRRPAGGDAFSIEDYQTEVRVSADSRFVGRTVADLERLAAGEVEVLTIIRERFRRYVPVPDWELLAGDILVLRSDAHVMYRLVAEARLELVHDKELEVAEGRAREVSVVEAVIAPGSAMIGRTVEELDLRHRFDVNLLAVGRRGQRIVQRLRRVRFQAGDLLVLRGHTDVLGERIAALGCLPLAERRLRLGDRPRAWLPVLILAGAMTLVGTGLVAVQIAFFGAAVAVLLVGALRLDEAYAAVDWPVLALLAALIPVSDSLRTTGATDLIAGWLSMVAVHLSPGGAVAMLLVAAMAVTPFMNNAATVLVMAPIGASLAQRLGLQPDPFLMAVAVGAACDFLTPIGHQCNTLVMGPGGYRFGDYWRLGLPLSLLVIGLGTWAILRYWPPG
ncbi:MAG: SLC13 family permease [Gammaproteobacteria bacterium]|nr:SLC13 family permease [Gammaproteobacteria bacterium]